MSEHQPTEAELMREQRLQRNLKILVAGLGALIILGLGAVIIRVIVLASRGPAGGTQHAIVGTTTGGGSLAVEIPKNAKIVSVSLSGNRLAIHHDGPQGAGIAILDIDTGRRVVDIKPVEAVPRN